MTRISATFTTLQQQHKKALIPYITAGDPHPDLTVPLLHALVAAGANILELGVPFSDPGADGPVIQAAHQRALKHQVSLAMVLQMVAEFRRKDQKTPIVLMGYANPLEIMGYENFIHTASQVGLDALLIVDIPPEEGTKLYPSLQAAGIDPIFLLSPTTSPQRTKMIIQMASGYLYYVSLKGVTGMGTINVAEVSANVEKLRDNTTLPITIGFGIRDAQSATTLAKVADGIIIGSALIERIAKCQGNSTEALNAAHSFLQEIRIAIDKNI